MVARADCLTYRRYHGKGLRLVFCNYKVITGLSALMLGGRKTVAKAEWGLKRICPHCNTRYYDMKKNPPVCPSCGAAFDSETLLRARRGKVVEVKKVAAPAPEEIIDDIPVAGNDEADDGVMEDTDELVGDEDVDEVIDGIEGDDDDRR